MFEAAIFRKFLALAVAAICASPAVAESARGPIVIELFTSQACSSCPPAHELLDELAARPDIIALGLHVNYWDYLGWRDMFGSPANTRRQRIYAEASDTRIVYTPQMVIDGAVSVVGSRREDVLQELALAAAHPKPARLVVQRDGAWLDIKVDVAGEVAPETRLEVTLFVFEPPMHVRPSRGENSGRRILHRNSVRDWHVLGEWSGAPVRWRAPAPQDAEGVAVVAQMPGGGPIMGAAKLILREDVSRISQSGQSASASPRARPATP